MKTKLPLIAALYCGLCSVGSAFTLDFNDVPQGAPGSTTILINVLGYGNVQFDTVNQAALIVNNVYENDSPGQTTSPSLDFATGDQVKVTFLGNQPSKVEFDWVGVNAGEFFTATQGSTLSEYIVTLNGTALEAGTSGAGLYQIGFQQVPEPSAALLGVIGASMLVLRRRR